MGMYLGLGADPIDVTGTFAVDQVPAFDSQPAPQPSGLSTLWKVLATVSAVASGYHGMKRHGGSIGWGIAWFALGGLFPVITPTIAVAQGFAKRK